jgi:hypothetical protein
MAPVVAVFEFSVPGRDMSGRDCGRGTAREFVGGSDGVIARFLGESFFGWSTAAFAFTLSLFERPRSGDVSAGWRDILDLRRSSVSRSKGRPALLDRASCLAENGTGAGGAATFRTTCR